jgi:hypothetical protein
LNVLETRDDDRQVTVRNDAAEEVPAYAALMQTGYDPDAGVYTVDQPDADSLGPARVLFNGPVVVPAHAYGQASRADPILALTSGIPAAGDSLGTAAGQWHLLAGNDGFVAWSDADDDDLAVVNQSGAGGSSATAMLRVTGKPYNVSGTRIYPGRERAKLGEPPAFADGPTKTWLVQEVGEVLGTTGTFVAFSKRDGSATVNGERRPLYRTDREIVMKDAACVAGVLTGTYNGTFEGDAAVTPALDFSMRENSQYLLLGFAG